MNIGNIVEKSTQWLKSKGSPTSRLDSEIILAHFLKMSRVELYQNWNKPLMDDELNKARAGVRQRGEGYPVAYIVGYKDFWNLRFHVSPAVLIPRPETEFVVDAALHHANKMNIDMIRILDLGAGSGCIGISIASSLITKKRFDASAVHLTCVEVSEEACQILNQNLKSHLNCSTEVVRCRAQDFGAKADGDPNCGYHLIVSNPPYISPDDLNIEPMVKKWEPSLALFSHQDGLKDIFEWSLHTHRFLIKGGMMAFEIGMGQFENVQQHFQNHFMDPKTGPTSIQVDCVKDLAGIERVICLID